MFIGEQHRRRSGLGLAQISSKVSPSAAGEQQSESSVNHSEDRENAGRASAQERNDMNVEPARLMEQLVSVQALLERFEKRLLVRESELIKKEREAAEQMEKLQSIVVG